MWNVYGDESEMTTSVSASEESSVMTDMDFGELQLSDLDGCGDYCQEQGQASGKTEVRRQILDIVQIYSTMQRFDDWCLYDTELTGSEWETLLTALQSNSALKEVEFWIEMSCPEPPATRGRMWGQLLKSSPTIKRLAICLNVDLGYSSALLSQPFRLPAGEVVLELQKVAIRIHQACEGFLTGIALGLRANPHSAIEELRLSRIRGDGTIKHLAEIIQLLPELRTLSFERMAVETSEGATDALASSLAGAISRHLRSLKFSSYEAPKLGFVQLLSKNSFPGSSRRFLNELRIAGPAPAFNAELADVLSALIGYNIIRKLEVSIEFCAPDMLPTFRADQWGDLGIAVVKSPALRTLTVGLKGFGFEGLINCLEEFGKSCQLSPKVDLRVEMDYSLYPGRHQNQVKYKSLSSWRQNLMKDLSLRSPDRTGREEQNKYEFLTWVLRQNLVKDLSLFSPDLDDPLFQLSFANIRFNSSITKLGIHTGNLYEGDSRRNRHTAKGWKQLFDFIRCTMSINHLDLVSCWELDDTIFKDMMELLHDHLPLETVTVCGTPWDFDGKGSIILLYLKYREVFEVVYTFLLRTSQIVVGGSNLFPQSPVWTIEPAQSPDVQTYFLGLLTGYRP